MVAVTNEDFAPRNAHAEVEAIVRSAGTSFYHGMRILPEERRRTMWAIYAFCRVVDDIADEPAPEDEKRSGLEAWRRRIDRLYETGDADHAITEVLKPAIERYGLRREDFLAIIEGMEEDTFEVIVAPSWDELDHYCDCVAAAVGRLSVRVFGESGHRGDEVAWALGRALQFTNILRDLSEDAARGRLYLPEPWLREAGVTITTPAEVLCDENLPRVCRRMAKQARRFFAAADRAMRDCDPKAMRPARMMAASYYAVLRALERRGWKDIARPVAVPKALKLWFVVRYGVLRGY
jgi:phytoene synthase